jgi:chaperonin GroES
VAKAKSSKKSVKANVKKITNSKANKIAKPVVKTKKTAKSIVSKISKIKKTIKKVIKSSKTTKPAVKLETKAKSKAKSLVNKTKSVIQKKSPSISLAKTKNPSKPILKTTKIAKSSKVAITPLDDRILVEVLPKTVRTPGGLYVPDSVLESENTEGVVIATGRGHQDKKGRLRPMDVKVGQTILFSKFSGNPVKLNNTDMVFIRENEILGIVD